MPLKGGERVEDKIKKTTCKALEMQNKLSQNEMELGRNYLRDQLLRHFGITNLPFQQGYDIPK